MAYGAISTSTLTYLQNATDRIFGWRLPSLPEDLWFVNTDNSQLVAFLSSIDQEAYVCFSPSELDESRDDVIHELTDAFCYPPVDPRYFVYDDEFSRSHIDIFRAMPRHLQ